MKRQKKQLAFKALQNVSIQYTQIDHIRERTFSFFPNVEYIILDHNQIETIDKLSFNGLSKLKSVNLSHNLIENIEEGTIGAELDLSHNPIKSTKSTKNIEETNDFVLIQQLLVMVLGIIFFCCIACAKKFLFTICSIISKFQLKITKYLHPNTIKIGKIQYDPKFLIAKNVYKGTLPDKRVVAVKKIKKKSNCNIPEVQILVRLSNDGLHDDNVIQYVLMEENKYSYYLALAPLCDKTLMEAIENKDDKVVRYLRAGPKSCLEQLAKGLKFIHNKKVQHRDIKPRNILIKYKDTDVRFIITDFDFGHITGKESNHKIRYGTKGWVAPELWGTEERSLKVDIFSMGCVFYYALTEGGHPFGTVNDMKICQENITKKILPTVDRGKLNSNQLINYRKEQAKDLIEAMITFDPNKRPSASEVLDHPFFWEERKMVRFFRDIGDCFDDIKAKDYASLRTYLRADTQTVFNGNWMDAIEDSEVKKDVKERNGKDMCSLLKVVRDKITHIDRMIESARKTSKEKGKTSSQKLVEIYKDKAGVAKYYNKLFPQLLIHTYYAKKRFDEENAAQV